MIMNIGHDGPEMNAFIIFLFKGIRHGGWDEIQHLVQSRPKDRLTDRHS